MSDTFANVSLPPGVEELTLTVPTRLPELTQILDWLALQIAPCLSPEHFWQVQLIIVEGFTNTVKYAHSCLPPPPRCASRFYPCRITSKSKFGTLAPPLTFRDD